MRAKVSSDIWFFWRDGQLICDLPRVRRQLALRPEAERLLREYADWTALDEGDHLAAQLLAAGILERENGGADANGDAWSRMGGQARYFHLANRTLADTQFLDADTDTRRLSERGVPLPPPFRTFPGRPHVELPEAAAELPAMPIGEVLRRRRSTRCFADEPFSLQTLATILRWTAGPLHHVDMPGFGPAVLKSSPSAGARHPIELYPVVRNVEGLDPGIYHYDAEHHRLDVVSAQPVPGDELLGWTGGQQHVCDAGVVLFHTAVLERTSWKYSGGTAYRGILLDLGHLSQTLYLVATAVGAGVLFTAALRDDPVEKALGVDWRHEAVLAATALGVVEPAEAERQDAMREGGPAAFSFVPAAPDGVDG